MKVVQQLILVALFGVAVSVKLQLGDPVGDLGTAPPPRDVETADEESEEPPVEKTAEEVMAEDKEAMSLSKRDSVHINQVMDFNRHEQEAALESDDPSRFIEADMDMSEEDKDLEGSAYYFTDSNHPGCWRKVTYIHEGTAVRVEGIDGLKEDGGSCVHGNKVENFAFEGIVRHDKDVDTIKVDFSEKGGPADLEAQLVHATDSAELHWADGNTWKQADNYAQYYSDPSFPSCPVVFSATRGFAMIKGVSPEDPSVCQEEDADGGFNEKMGTPWTVYGTVHGDTVTFDMSPMGGPKEAHGKVDARGIDWAEAGVGDGRELGLWETHAPPAIVETLSEEADVSEH